MPKSENQNIEFKEQWRDDVLKSICAFANTDGGTVYIGSHTQLRVYDNKLWLWNAGGLPEGITIDKLKKPHSSCLRNELLADVFFKAGFIESWGRGTLKIVNRCKEKGLPEPEFSELTGGFLTCFYKAEYDVSKDQFSMGLIDEKFGEGSEKVRIVEKERVTEKVTKKVTERVTENQAIILSRIQANPYITIKDLSNIVGISERKIKDNIRKLKSKKLLKRIGPARGGYWEVIKK